MNVAEELGRSVAGAWRARGGDERDLPDVAASILSGREPPDRRAILKWLLESEPLPEQRHPEGGFGSPAVTLYSNERFYIEALFWLEGSTAIHRHGFSGAFQVLSGSSLHCEYGFEQVDRVHSRLCLGNLALRKAELLGAGDSRVIRAGSDFIHAAFHLDRPTVTLVVRSVVEPDHQPQFSFLPPHLAVDPFFTDPVVERRIQALQFLLMTEPTEFFSAMRDLAGSTDFETARRMLQLAYEKVRQSAWFDEFVGQLRRRFSTRVDKLLAVHREADRRERLFKLRAPLNELEPRFVLAAVQNVPGRAALLEVTRARYPDRTPASVIAAHADKLLETPSDSKTRAVLERMLDGATREQIDEKALFDTLRAAPLLEPLWNG